MPSFKKRSRSFSRRRVSKKARTLVSSLAARVPSLAYNVIKSHAPTILKFPFSYFCKQPMPDRYMTWLTSDVVGFLSSGSAASGSWGHSINNVVFPWNQTGGTGNVIPNPPINPNSINPAGLRNLLYNSTSGTGLYLNYRVWSTVCQYTFTPATGGDAVIVAVAPVNSNTFIFSNITQVGQAPNSVEKVMTNGVASDMNSLVQTFSIPQIFGISKKDFETYAPSIGTYSTAPSSLLINHVWYQTTDDGTTTNRIGILQTMKMHVEFFGRADAQILDN